MVVSLGLFAFRVPYSFDIVLYTMATVFIMAVAIGVYVLRKRKRALYPVYTTSKWEQFLPGCEQSLLQAGFEKRDKAIRLIGRSVGADCFYKLDKEPRRGLICTCVVFLEGVSTMENVKELEPKLDELAAEWILEQKKGKASLRNAICFVQETFTQPIKKFCTATTYSYPYYSTVMAAYEKASDRLFYLSGNDFSKASFRKAVSLVEQHMASGKLPKDDE